MLDSLLASLRRRSDVIGWTVRHDRIQGAQLFYSAGSTEAERQVREERFHLSVVCPTSGPYGTGGCRTGA